MPSGAEAVALRLTLPTGAFPAADDWLRTSPITFAHDWQGRNLDPERETAVRVMWDDQTIYLQFCCKYRSIRVFSEADANGRRDELWDRDVAEVFLQPDRFGEKYYKEFEVSPNGQWLDLDISPTGLAHITSGLRSRVKLDEPMHLWTAELAIPIASITSNFNPAQSWRVNFFRCEGLEPDRFYGSWQPTETEQPNFHVPQKFGWLRFER